MQRRIKLLVIAGARPNFMKIAPLSKAIAIHNRAGNQPGFDFRLIHTGQHYDNKMSDVFFEELGIPSPDINLGVGSGTHAEQTAAVMTAFEPICAKERPDWVVVVGDVNSTLACTLVAAKLGVKVAHIEAGLRSFDRSMPEEINRIVTDALADLLFTPSQDADENLKREGVDDSKVWHVGNIMIDALLANLEKARASAVLERYNLTRQNFAYVTLHRPSNVDDPVSLSSIMVELTNLGKRMPVVFPMHPRTRKMCSEFSIDLCQSEGIKILDPIGYHDSLCLTENARLVLTDSGGLQEETTFFRTPCLTLRPNTERPVTISIGSNRLTNADNLAEDISKVLHSDVRRSEVPAFWDGKTAERIIKVLLEISVTKSTPLSSTEPKSAIVC